ncbi:MAG: HU family DNA-binding protein [Mangrovibacterium sp.]
MAIYYRLDKKTDNLNPEKDRKRELYPRVISKGTWRMREFCERAARGTTVNPYELEIAIKIIFDQVASDLKDGHHVCFDGIGTFSVTAESVRPVEHRHDIRAESIRLKKIVFKPSSILMKTTKYWKFERMLAR